MKTHKFILSTHYRIDSAPQALRDYIRIEKLGELLYIAHPLKSTGAKELSYCEKSDGERILTQKKSLWKSANVVISAIHELLLTLMWVVKNGKSDIFIGVDNLNAFAGILLKKFGYTGKLIYYTIDFFPQRFSNELINNFYHWLDRICVLSADEVWNVSSQMVFAREKKHKIDKQLRLKQHIVPIGIWYSDNRNVKLESENRYKIIFIGHLIDYMGVDLAIAAMPILLKKIPEIRFEVIGGGPEEAKLQDLTYLLGVKQYVSFKGWVKDRKKVHHLLTNAAIGIAPFNTNILDEKVKNADPGKIKDYMNAGLPIIVTKAVRNWRKLQQENCAKIIDYSIESYTESVLQLLSNKRTLVEYRRNAHRYIKRFDYNLIFSHNLKRVLHG